MIDISLYTQKLNWLKEWIAMRIDGKISPPIWVDVGELNFNYSINQIMDIYNQCGVLFFGKEDIMNNKAIPFSFEEYCKYKKTNTKTNQ